MCKEIDTLKEMAESPALSIKYKNAIKWAIVSLGDEIPEKTKEKRYKYDDGDMRIASWFNDRVKMITASTKDASLESWANTIRMIREIDGKNHREISAMIDWCNKDEFWCKNILSPEKLRKQWDKLNAQRINNETTSRNQTKRLTAQEADDLRLLEQYGDTAVRNSRPASQATGFGVGQQNVSGLVHSQMEQKGIACGMAEDAVIIEHGADF